MNSPRSIIPRTIIAALILALPTARAAFPTVGLKPVCLQQIHSPTTITHAPDGSGRLFVCDQLGKIYIIQGGMLLPTPFLDISSEVLFYIPPQLPTGYSERGLLGLAFHPGFADSLSPGYRKLYVNYNKAYQAGTDPAPPQAGDPVNCVTVIAEFQVSMANPNFVVPSSERRLLVFTQPQSNHNGGQLEFGPDGMLYIGTGDGGGSQDNGTGHTGREVSTTSCLGNSQDKTRYLGKILRINPIDPDGAGPLTYSIPSDNPFFNDVTPGLKKEIYAFGLRNPWKFSFDKRLPSGTNRLFCGDVGQGRIEEVNLIVSGGNYGWRYNEGLELPTFSSGSTTDPMPHPGGTLIDPIAMYAHPGVTTSPVLPQLGLSVTGGFVYRGAAIPALQGKYVFGDYGSTAGASDGRIMGLEETSPGVFTLTNAIPLLGQANPVVGQRILTLGEDEAGEIYIGMKTNSGVLALDPPGTGLPAGGIYKIVPVQNMVSLTPNKDNTIFSDTVPRPPITGFPSDALGYLYAGRTGTNHGPYLRRALISFDVAAQIPAGAQIQSAQLTLRLTKLGPGLVLGTTAMTLRRLTETWGEGTSMNASDVGFGAQATTDDATWSRRFFDTQSWTTQGGTSVGTVSASAVIAFPVTTLGSTAQLVSDVQGWLNTPGSNAGWILRGDENNNETACQIASREKGPTPPTLEVTYNAMPPPTHFEAWLATHFPANLVGQYVDPDGDLDGDGIKNQIEYSYGFSPVAADPADSGLQVSSTEDGPNTVFTITFRRDPLATDLTYALETSSDLVNWSAPPIVQSVGGADSTGSGLVSDSDIIGEEPMRLVTARESLPTPANRFVRLRISRAP